MKILVVDDEPLARRRLAAMIDDLELGASVEQAENGEQAISQVNSFRPDIVFLDIRMPKMDGLEAARHLARSESPPAVIFTTAYDQHALAAFEANAIDYLLKPVKRERLEAAVKKGSSLKFGTSELQQPRSDSIIASVEDALGKNARRTHLSAVVQGKLKLLPLDEVILLRSDQKYTQVIWSGAPVLIEESLKQLEDELGSDFVRVHRNAIVRINKIESLSKTPTGQTEVRMHGVDEPVVVARRLVSQVRATIKGK